MARMMHLVKGNKQDILDNYSQSKVRNGWFDVTYSGFPSGIFGAARPIEPLHSLGN
jgi:hypothetical protein